MADVEAIVRSPVQRWLSRMLEAEDDAGLGRSKSTRRAQDAAPGDRNEYDTPRHVALMGGTSTVLRPCARGLDAHLARRVLPQVQRRTSEVAAVLSIDIRNSPLVDF